MSPRARWTLLIFFVGLATAGLYTVDRRITSSAGRPAELLRVQGVPDSLPPPTPTDVAIRIRSDQSGSEVRVPVGTRFSVELQVVHSLMFKWTPAQVPDFLRFDHETSGPTSQDRLAGESVHAVFIFFAERAGTGDLEFEMQDQWARSQPRPNREQFAVTIVAE